MRPYFRCRHCKKRLVPLVHRLSHHIWGRERVCPKCGRIWRLGATAYPLLIASGVVGGIVFLYIARGWFKPPETDILVWGLWLPLYVFVIWPSMFALLGNGRLK